MREDDPVRSIIVSASSLIVNSPGLPRLTGPCHLNRRAHKAEKATDEIIDIAEGTRLAAIAINRDILSMKSLDNKISIRHARPLDACADRRC